MSKKHEMLLTKEEIEDIAEGLDVAGIEASDFEDSKTIDRWSDLAKLFWDKLERIDR